MVKIAIDFDSVLANTIKKWVQIFNSDYSVKYQNKKLAYNQITTFGFYDDLNISQKDTWKIFAQCWEEWDMLEPTEFMLDVKTKKLSELSERLDVVTANEPKNKTYIEKFLDKYNIKYHSIIFEENKEKLHHDIFIDDSPHTVLKIYDAGKTALLYDQPWNKDVDSKKTKDRHLSRVFNIDHAIHMIQDEDNARN